MIYVDTSLVVAYYCPEAISKRAESIIRGKQAVFISDLTEVELMSALSRKVRIQELSREDAISIRSYFVAHLKAGIYRRTSLGSHHVVSAREFLAEFKTPLRTLDALHLALVISENLQLVTADEAFARAAKALSVRAIYISAKKTVR